MGTWGPNLYQNDTSLDVKDEFEKLYNEGKNVQEITDILTEDYKSIIGDIEEEPLFWLALADTQWEFGVLLPVVKHKRVEPSRPKSFIFRILGRFSPCNTKVLARRRNTRLFEN